jgi:hypothetical protein
VNDKKGEGEVMEQGEILIPTVVDVKYHDDSCALIVRFPGTPESEEVDE